MESGKEGNKRKRETTNNTRADTKKQLKTYAYQTSKRRPADVMKKGALEKYLIGPSVAAKKTGPSQEGELGLGFSNVNKDDPSSLIVTSGKSP